MECTRLVAAAVVIRAVGAIGVRTASAGSSARSVAAANRAW